jgi:hypothetical protein
LKTEIVLKGILLANQSFQGGEKLILFQIGISSYVEVTHVSLERKPSVLEAGASSTLFAHVIDLGFERNTSCNLLVSRSM